VDSFGDRLRQARESRGIPLEEVAREAKVSPHLLEALEHDDLASLPGGPFNKGFVRAYARCVGLDPEEAVADYTRAEQSLGLRTPDAGTEPRPKAGRFIELRLEDDRKLVILDWSVLRWVLLSAGVIALTGISFWILAGGGSRSDRRDAAALAVSSAPSRETASVVTPRQVAPIAPPPAPEATPPGEAPPAVPAPPPEPRRPTVPGAARAARITIPESGVGTRVVDRRLAGRGTAFAEGTGVIFWTLVTGAQAGESIRHVWMRDGRMVASNTLEVGGSRWRCWSRKTLASGSAGDWSVEARDAAGTVLARQEFTCTR
jgi:cytoskeletal protein RodZ